MWKVIRKLTKFLKFGKFIIFIIVLSCSIISEQPRKIYPSKLNIIQKLILDFVPQKCCYSESSQTIFIMEKETNKIHIFRDGKQINIIGGLGFEKNNFSKLADITLSPDGSLLALDSFQKTIKKFDSTGKWIAELSLENISEPTLFDISIDETLYIFDDNSCEIFLSKNFNENNLYSFGKFSLTNPSQLILAKNNLIILDENKTLIFDTFGQFVEELDGNFQFDRFQKYELKKYFIEHQESGKKFAISPNSWNVFMIQNNYCFLLSDNEVWIFSFAYEKF